MSYEPEIFREERIRHVLRARGTRDAREGLPQDPDPLSDDGHTPEGYAVDLTSFVLSEPEYRVSVFLAAYRGGYREGAGLSGVVGS